MFGIKNNEKLDLLLKQNENLSLELADLQDTVEELSSSKTGLEKEKEKLQKEIRELQHKRKLEEQELKATVKIAQEKRDIELSKRELELERDADKRIMEIKTEYQSKTEEQLEKQLTNMKGMYSEILQRLPNINAKLNGEL